MATLPRGTPVLLWTLQWSLAAAFYLLGLLKATLPIEDLQQRLHIVPGAQEAWLWLAGLFEVAAGMALVIPSATRFLPGLTPLAAACLALTEAGGVVLNGTAAGLGLPLLDGALAFGCLGVAIGRGLLLPTAPLDSWPAPKNPPAVRPSAGSYALVVQPAGAGQDSGGSALPARVEPNATARTPGRTWHPPPDPDGAEPSRTS